MTQISRAGRPKSKEKNDAILRAAVELFLAQGVKQTSMEEVAKHSGVSKQTIYSHFQNKDALFLEVIAFKCQEHMIEIEHLADHVDGLEGALTLIGSKFLALFQDEEVIAMYANIIAEAKNSPGVAELFYQAGPSASLDAVADIIYSMTEQQIDKKQAKSLAVDFYCFLKGNWHMRSLMNMEFKLDESQREAHIHTVVAKTMVLLNNYYAH